MFSLTLLKVNFKLVINCRDIVNNRVLQLKRKENSTLNANTMQDAKCYHLHIALILVLNKLLIAQLNCQQIYKYYLIVKYFF